MTEALDIKKASEISQKIACPISLLVKQESTSFLTTYQRKEILRLFKHLSDDVCRKHTHISRPPSWLLKSLIEQCGVREYESVEWRRGILLISELLEDKLMLEKQGLPQFLDSALDPLFPNSSGYSYHQALSFVRAIATYLRELNTALIKQLRTCD